jgi:hypothetical protein
MFAVFKAPPNNINIYISLSLSHIPGKHWGLLFQVHSGKVGLLIGGLKKSNLE